jgi:site-specific recombinase XerD
MTTRESRFTTTKSTTKEMAALPILHGDVSIYANPVDTYLAGKSDATGRMMSQGEIKALVDACLSDTVTPKNKNEHQTQERSPAAFRDLAILGMMYIGGLRRSEVADLNVEDIDLKLKETRIIGKGNKERMLFLDDGTITAIEQWLALRGNHEGALFYRVLKNGKIQVGRLSDQAIYNIVKKRQVEAGISEISPHDFRKTFISTILEETGDLRMAQALAGHSDPKTTANYDRRKQENMRKAANTLHFPLVMNGDEQV